MTNQDVEQDWKDICDEQVGFDVYFITFKYVLTIAESYCVNLDVIFPSFLMLDQKFQIFWNTIQAHPTLQHKHKFDTDAHLV